MRRFALLTVLSAAALAAAAPRPSPGRLPLQFEENRGQTDARVRYLARSSDRTLFLTADGAVLSAAGEAGGCGCAERIGRLPSKGWIDRQG